MAVCDYQVDAESAVIMMNNPPVNGLSHELRKGIKDGLDRAVADPDIKSVILIGASDFSGGADIREFNTPKHHEQPTLTALIAAIEQSPKPVIGAISGSCMGGGFELALGCHFRVATSNSRVALPEVKLGIMPGAGGTQRLPRLIGMERALSMIISGDPLFASELGDTAMFDKLTDSELRASSLAFASQVIAEKRPLKRARDLNVEIPNSDEFFEMARRKATKSYPGPLKCIEALAASVSKPFEEGLSLERKLFLQLMDSPESHALRYSFFSERASAKIPDVPADTPVQAIKKAAVIGLGTMGTGIAMTFANAGIPVVVLEANPERLERGLGVIRNNYETTAKKGRMTSEQVEQVLALIEPTLEYGTIADADIIIESVFEDLSAKQAVFEKLDATIKVDAILATNTSALNVNTIAKFTKRPQQVVGTHFFSPANVMRLLEVVRGEKTSKSVLATVMKLAKTIKKVAVVSGVCDGFIGNRIFDMYRREAMFMLEEGALPQQIDTALESFGMAMGPFRVADLAGNDISWNIRKRRYVERPSLVYPRVADRLCELGRFGQKTNAGWYLYQPGNKSPQPDPLVEQMIVEYSKERKISRRLISDGEIVERCIFALINEGARVLEEGIALRSSDIDVVFVAGYGFPRHRGGPMFYADQPGIPEILARMECFGEGAHRDSKFWQPAPLLVKLADEGRNFKASHM